MSDGGGERFLLRFFAGVMVVFGAIVAVISGLCTWIFSGFSVAQSPGQGLNTEGLSVLALFGGIPFVFGIALVVGGVLLWRSAGRPPKGPS